MKSKKTLRIAEILRSRFPATRDSAYKLFAGLTKRDVIPVFDFANIEVPALGFLDSILCMVEVHYPDAEFINGSEFTSKMIDAVKERRRHRHDVFKSAP